MSGSPLNSETETDAALTSASDAAPSGSDFNADDMIGGLLDDASGGGESSSVADEGVFAPAAEDHDGSQEEAALAQGADLEPEKPAAAKPRVTPGADHARKIEEAPAAKPGEKKARGPTREQLAALVAQDIQAQAALGPLGQAQARAQTNTQQAAPAIPAPPVQTQPQQQAHGPANAAPLALAPEAIKAMQAEFGEPIKPLLDNYNALAGAFQQQQQQNQLLASVVTRILDERLIQEEAEFNDTLDELRQQGYTDIYGTDNENMTPAQQRALALLDQHVSGLRDRVMGSRQRVGLADLVHSAHAGIHRERVQKQAAEAERKKLQGQVKQAHRRQDVLPGGGSGRPVARGASPTEHLEALVGGALSSRTQ